MLAYLITILLKKKCSNPAMATFLLPHSYCPFLPVTYSQSVLRCPRHMQGQPVGTKNRTQLALQGLHISSLSQCAPKYSDPSCYISSSKTSGGFLLLLSLSLCMLEPFLTSVEGPWQAYYSHKIYGLTQEDLIKKSKTETLVRWKHDFFFFLLCLSLLSGNNPVITQHFVMAANGS